MSPGEEYYIYIYIYILVTMNVKALYKNIPNNEGNVLSNENTTTTQRKPYPKK